MSELHYDAVVYYHSKSNCITELTHAYFESASLEGVNRPLCPIHP